MEYEINISGRCLTEEQRLLVERSIVEAARSKFKISPHDLRVSGCEVMIDITWHGTETPFQEIESMLTNIATEQKMFFEVDYTSDEMFTGPQFIGFGGVEAETDYLIEQLRELLPRLMKRIPQISKRLDIPQKDLAKSFMIFVKKRTPESSGDS